MSNKPLVTVMVPTYNQHKYIEKTINSILNQTYDNIEIIISDDSINDLTEKLIKEKYLNKKYKGKNIVYVHNRPSKGEVGNYKYLLYKLANGEWVLNVDGDDFLYNKYFIEIAMDYVMKNSNIVLITSKKLKYDIKNQQFIKIDNIPYQDLIINGEWLFFNHIFKNVELPHVGTIFHRQKALEVDFYEYDIPSSDRESLLKLSLKGDIVYLNDYYGVWVYHGNNHSQNVEIDELLKNLKMYDRVYDYAKQFKLFKPKLLFWKILAKHKMLFFYYKNEKNKLKFLKKLLKKSKLNTFLLVIDIRSYL